MPWINQGKDSQPYVLRQYVYLLSHRTAYLPVNASYGNQTDIRITSYYFPSIHKTGYEQHVQEVLRGQEERISVCSWKQDQSFPI